MSRKINREITICEKDKCLSQINEDYKYCVEHCSHNKLGIHKRPGDVWKNENYDTFFVICSLCGQRDWEVITLKSNSLWGQALSHIEKETFSGRPIILWEEDDNENN